MGSLGPHDGFLLKIFGVEVFKGWGHHAYHVGSSLTEKARYRDVDVRLILPDDEYHPLFGDDLTKDHDHAKWNAHNLAWTMFGRKTTGLPIDFQIQSQTYANEVEECKGPRSALLLVEDDFPVVRNR